MDPNTIYIAGPMRGYPLLNFPAFDEAKAQLSVKGWNVISPADLDREAGIDPEAPVNFELVQKALTRDLQAIMNDVSCLAMLPGWAQSNGARCELFLAFSLGKPVYEFEDGKLGKRLEGYNAAHSIKIRVDDGFIPPTAMDDVLKSLGYKELKGAQLSEFLAQGEKEAERDAELEERIAAIRQEAKADMQEVYDEADAEIEGLREDAAEFAAEDATEDAQAKQWRKDRPLYSGVLAYFPDAVLELANCSRVGNEQHNPGEPLHWDRSKSADHLDSAVRHINNHKKEPMDKDGVLHLIHAFWRLGAASQELIEQLREDSRPWTLSPEEAAEIGKQLMKGGE